MRPTRSINSNQAVQVVPGNKKNKNARIYKRFNNKKIYLKYASYYYFEYNLFLSHFDLMIIGKVDFQEKVAKTTCFVMNDLICSRNEK